MKEKILSAVFVISFTLTGCGIESIFDEQGLPFWIFCFGVTATVGYFLFGRKGD